MYVIHIQFSERLRVMMFASCPAKSLRCQPDCHPVCHQIWISPGPSRERVALGEDGHEVGVLGAARLVHAAHEPRVVHHRVCNQRSRVRWVVHNQGRYRVLLWVRFGLPNSHFLLFMSHEWNFDGLKTCANSKPLILPSFILLSCCQFHNPVVNFTTAKWGKKGSWDMWLHQSLRFTLASYYLVVTIW